jgi:hypothetical protein
VAVVGLEAWESSSGGEQGGGVARRRVGEIGDDEQSSMGVVSVVWG